MGPKYRVLQLAAATLLAAGALPAKDYSADRFDVRLRIERDGSAEVTETVVFRFEGGPFTYIFRDVATGGTDGIADIRGWIDGRPAALEIRDSEPIRVTWRFEPVSDSTRTVMLSYRVFGVIHKDPDGDTLSWQAIPGNLQYPIAASSVEVEYPAGMALVRPLGIRGAKAVFETGANLVRAQMGATRRKHGVAVTAVFPPGSLIAELPRWQAAAAERRRKTSEALPVGFGAGAAALILGVLLFARLRSSVPPHAGLPPLPVTARRPPSDIAPAVAGRLGGRWHTSGGMHALAALFELARRGVLRIEEDTHRRFHKRDFWILQRPHAAALAPHEEALLRLVFPPGKEPSGRARMSEFAGRLAYKSSRFDRVLRSDMVAAGLIDPARQARRGRTIGLGLAFVFGGMVVAFAAVAWSGFAARRGDWGSLRLATGLIGAGSGVFLAGIAGLVVAARMSSFSLQGAIAAAAWRGFAAHLSEVSKGRGTLDDRAALDRYLPYATAFGFGPAWAKRFGLENADLPEWFQAFAHGDGFTAFVAMTSAASSDGGAGASAAGASGGGGGGAG